MSGLGMSAPTGRRGSVSHSESLTDTSGHSGRVKPLDLVREALRAFAVSAGISACGHGCNPLLPRQGVDINQRSHCERVDLLTRCDFLRLSRFHCLPCCDDVFDVVTPYHSHVRHPLLDRFHGHSACDIPRD